MDITLKSEVLSLEEGLTDCKMLRPRRNQFLLILYSALENKEYESALCWNPDGTALILKNPEAITKKVLVDLFGGMLLSSFIRQLSYYGFKRISRRSNVKVYTHPQFQRGRWELLKSIRRNNKDAYVSQPDAKKSILNKGLTQRDIMQLMQSRIDNLEAEVDSLRIENTALRSHIQSQRRIDQAKQFQDYQDRLAKQDQEYQANGIFQMFFTPQLGGYINKEPWEQREEESDCETPIKSESRSNLHPSEERLNSDSTEYPQYDILGSNSDEYLREKKKRLRKSPDSKTDDSSWNYQDFIGEDN